VRNRLISCSVFCFRSNIISFSTASPRSGFGQFVSDSSPHDPHTYRSILGLFKRIPLRRDPGLPLILFRRTSSVWSLIFSQFPCPARENSQIPSKAQCVIDYFPKEVKETTFNNILFCSSGFTLGNKYVVHFTTIS
jgi:hypothetical protein